MDLSKVNFVMMNWCSEDNGYWSEFGHYTLVPNKKIRKTKLSFNCWLKKKECDAEQINMIIRIKENYIELKFHYSKGKNMCWYRHLGLLETNSVLINQIPKIAYENLKINGKQMVITQRSYNSSLYIHFTESKHQKLKEKEREHRLPSKKHK